MSYMYLPVNILDSWVSASYLHMLASVLTALSSLGSFNPFPRMIRTACHVPGNTASVLSVLQVQRWLRRCSATHPKCGSIGLDVPLPTRLIDVESGLRLVETKDMHGRYVCLSHCWGNQDPTTAKQTFKTTKKNLSSSLKNIDFTSLPRTFTDAIIFTRKLRLKYLWIDSICIIQDDEGDWRHEASLMANIYENAVLTLGATASASDAEGLFRSSSSIHDPIELRGKTPKGKRYSVYARRQLPHSMGAEPLFKRGWIFQERYLSPRFLHFAPNELIWECRDGMDCECNKSKLLEITESNPIGYFNAFKSSYLEAFTASPYRVQVAWRDVVHAYTELNLSHAKDKLPALSGIAKKFIGLRPQDRYLAGLWEFSFVQDLLWHASSYGSSEKGLQPRPEKWRAPTWSWASVDSTVETRGASHNHGKDDGPGMASCIDVLAVNCVPAGDDITGELSSGYAVLRGSIMAAYFRFKRHSYESHCVAKEGYEKSFFPDYRFDVENDFRVRDGDCVFCLRIATDSPMRETSLDEFLVLRRKRGTIRMFERIELMMLAVDGNDFYQMFESRREEYAINIV